MKKLSIVTLVLFSVGAISGTLIVYNYLATHYDNNSISGLYSYSNYAQMTIICLDRTVLQQQEFNFIDMSNNTAAIPKLQESIDKVGTKYDILLEKCSNNTIFDGYCNEIPMNTAIATNITSDEFQKLDKILQLKELGMSTNDTWFSYIKYRHDGCFPFAHGLQLDQSKSDNYCYYRIIVEKR